MRRPHGWIGIKRMTLVSMPQRRRLIRLHRVDTHFGIEFMGRDTSSRGAAATTSRRNYHVNVRQVFENLGADRPDTGNQQWLGRGMNVTITSVAREPLDLQTGFVKIAAVQAYFSGQIAHCLHL